MLGTTPSGHSPLVSDFDCRWTFPAPFIRLEDIPTAKLRGVLFEVWSELSKSNPAVQPRYSRVGANGAAPPPEERSRRRVLVGYVNGALGGTSVRCNLDPSSGDADLGTPV